MPESVISNTSPLFYLHQVGHLTLLQLASSAVDAGEIGLFAVQILQLIAIAGVKKAEQIYDALTAKRKGMVE